MIDAARRPRSSIRIGARDGRTAPQRRLAHGRHIAAATLATLAALATGVGYGESHRSRIEHIGEVASPTAAALHPVDPPDSLSVAEFKTFALNALLIPLLDDGASPSWLDPFFTTAMSLAIDCEAARVSIDGRPLVPSAPVPARAFTLRWSMDRCVILNGRTSLTGDVELLVFHDGDRYTARLRPIDLHVLSDAGDEVMNRPFSTSTPLAPWTPS
ncbi:MAG: hypothetical protein ABIS28_18300 [Caldimonas sp.]